MVILCATAGRCHHALTLIAYGSLVGASTPSGLAYANATEVWAKVPIGSIAVKVGVKPRVIPHMSKVQPIMSISKSIAPAIAIATISISPGHIIVVPSVIPVSTPVVMVTSVGVSHSIIPVKPVARSGEHIGI
jgi:hypothetical protein